MSDVYKNCPAFENDRFLLRFSYDDGVIDVEPIRDEARILTGLSNPRMLTLMLAPKSRRH